MSCDDSGGNPPIPVPDRDGPTFTSVPAGYSKVSVLPTVEISFSEDVIGADKASGYSVGGHGGGDLSIVGVDVITDTKYRLRLSGKVEPGMINIFFKNITDRAGNSPQHSGVTLNGFPNHPSVAVTPARNKRIKELAQIELSYSETVNGAAEKSNYVLAGPGKGSLFIDDVNDNGNNEFTVKLGGTPAEGEIELTINNITNNDGHDLLENIVTYIYDTTFAGIDTITPGDKSKGARLDTSIVVEFNEQIDPDTVNGTTFMVNDGAVLGTVTKTATSATFTPYAPFDRGKEYSVKLTTGIKDIGGNNNSADITSTFRTTWTITNGTNYPDEGNAITLDSSGNLYITGYTYSDLDGNAHQGGQDIFITKYNNSGIRQWTTTASSGNQTDEYGTDIALDSAGNIYASGVLNVDSSSNTKWYNEVYLVKLDSSGNAIFDKSLKWELNGSNLKMDIDQNDKLAISGITRHRHVKKFDTDGNEVWDLFLPWISGGNYRREATDIVIDSLNRLVVCGEFQEESTSDDISFTIAFDDKKNTVGYNHYSAAIGSGNEDARAKAVTVNKDNTIIVAGVTYSYFYGEKNRGFSDVFIAYNKAPFWHRQIGTNKGEDVTAIATDSNNNIYVAINTRGNMSPYANLGEDDAYIVKYSDTGVHVWTRQIGTIENDEVQDVIIDSSDTIYVLGNSGGDLFGSYNKSKYSANVNNSFDYFIVKMDSDGNIQ